MAIIDTKNYWIFLTVFGLTCCVFGLLLTHGMPGRIPQNNTVINDIDDGFTVHPSLNDLKILKNKISSEFEKMTNDENFNRFIYGLMDLKIGKKSLKTIKKNLLKLKKKLNENCIDDMIRAVENLASIGLYASSCNLDYSDDPDKLLNCYNNNTSSLQWSATLFDSWGKIPSGLLSSGPFFFMGEYDQCLSINIPLNPKNIDNEFDDFNISTQNAQYCKLDLHVKDPIKDRQIPLSYGICAPQTCQNKDIKELLLYISDGWIFDIIDDNENDTILVQCHDPDKKFIWNNGDIVFVLIVSLLLLTVIIGTILDIFSKKFKLKIGANSRHVAGYDYRKFYNFNDDETTTFTQKYLPIEEYIKDLNYINHDGDIERLKTGKCSSYKQTFMSIMEDELSVAHAPSVALTYKGGEDLKETFRKSSFLMDIITAFSIQKSVEHLLRESGSQIKCLHGIKVLSAIWVIIGHSFLLPIGYIGNPKILIKKIKLLPISQWILNSSLAVDSFFFMAGAVLAFSFRRRLISAKNDKSRLHRLFQITRWIVVFFHRILRLLPSYIIVLGLVSTVFNKLGNGPMWDQDNGIFGTKCDTSSWWQHLLFILNFFPTECMPWMWYISLDMQFYFVAPLCLYLLYKVSAFGKAIIGLFIFSSSVYRIVIYALYNFPSNIILKMVEKESVINEEAAQMYGLLYAAPQARMAPFYIGLLIGWILAVKKKKKSKSLKRNWLDNKLYRMALRVLSLLLLGWSLYGSEIQKNNHWYSVLYSSQYRITWSLGLGLLVWMCERKYFEPLGAVLGWNKWIPLSRLCFGIYLSHELLIIMTVYQRRHVWIVEGPAEIITYALGIAVLSILCAIILAFLVELPPLILERKLFMRTRQNIRLKKNDDGQLTVFESPNILKKSKKNKKDFYSISDLTPSKRESFGIPTAREMPGMPSEIKVRQWLTDNEKSDEILIAEAEVARDTLTINSDEASVSQKLDNLYPWDNPEWISDTRIGHQTINITDSTQVTAASHFDTFSIQKNEKNNQQKQSSLESKFYGSFDV